MRGMFCNMVEMKVFGLFDASEVRVEDPGLKKAINLQPKLMLKSHGRIKWDPARAKVNVVERLVNLLQVPGSRGKKHRIITGWITGKHTRCTGIVIDAFKIIEEKTGENPFPPEQKSRWPSSQTPTATKWKYWSDKFTEIAFLPNILKFLPF